MFGKRENILSPPRAVPEAGRSPESCSLTANARPHIAPYVRLPESTTFEVGGWKLYLSPALAEKASGENGEAPLGARVYLTFDAGTTLVVCPTSRKQPANFQLTSGVQQLGANMTQATIAIQWTDGSVSSFHLDPSYLEISSPLSAWLKLEGLFALYLPPDCLLSEARPQSRANRI